MGSGADKDVESISKRNETTAYREFDFYTIQATTITFISRLLIKMF